MKIELQWEIDEPCPEGIESFLDEVAQVCMQTEGIEGAGFAIRVTDDEEIQRLNREMRGIDRVTDVLSFPTVAFPKGTYAHGNAKIHCAVRLSRRTCDGGASRLFALCDCGKFGIRT